MLTNYDCVIPSSLDAVHRLLDDRSQAPLRRAWTWPRCTSYASRGFGQFLANPGTPV